MQRSANVSHGDGVVVASGDHHPHSATAPDQHDAHGESSLQQGAMECFFIYMNTMHTAPVYCKLNSPVGIQVDKCAAQSASVVTEG